MRWTLVISAGVALVGCGKAGSGGGSGTATDGSDPTPVGSTAPTSDSDVPTGDTGTAPVCIEVQAQIARHDHDLLWTEPGGAAVATGALGSMVRDPAGGWVDDPDVDEPDQALFLDGSSIDNVLAAGAFGLVRRDAATGTWAHAAFPGVPHEIRALIASAADDVTVVSFDEDGRGGGELRVYRVGPGGWSLQTQQLDAEVEHAAALPDGRLVLGTLDGMMVGDAEGFELLPGAPDDAWVRRVEAGEDGTVVGLIYRPPFPESSVVLLGDGTGVSLVDPGFDGTYWVEGAVRRADDIWLVGGDWQGPVVAHYDGAGWSKVPCPTSEPLFDVSLVDGGVVVLAGSAERQLVLSGDVAGLAVELEEVSVWPVDELVVDDVEGTVWGFSEDGAARFDGVAWRPEPHPFPDVDMRWTFPPVAVSGGRMVAFGDQQLLTRDGEDLWAWPVPEGQFLVAVAGVDGVFFALGAGSDPVEPLVGYRGSGSDWQPIDLSVLPEDASIRSLWADGSDDLWVGYSNHDSGGVVHWDGTSSSIVVRRLPDDPSWIRRLSDGLLWFEAGGLFTWDGTDATLVEGLPVTATGAHRMPDGTLYVRSRKDEGLVDERTALDRFDPDGTVEEVFAYPYALDLVGDDGLVMAVSSGGELAYWASCPP